MRESAGGAAREEEKGASPGCVGSTAIYDGRVVHLDVDRVRFPDGSTGELEVVRHVGAAAVLPVVGELGSDPEILLLRQYRYAADGELFEVPAGTRESPDEAWDACARRELEEETGYRAGALRPLTRIFTTPGFTDEEIHLFLATGLVPGKVHRDDDEFIEVVRLPLGEAVGMIRAGAIVDAKSIVTILYAAAFVPELR